MKQAIGVIGVGSMGGAIARNLLKAGYQVFVFDIRREASEVLATLGARIVSSPYEMGKEAQLIITMLPSGDGVKDAATGSNGFMKSMKRGGVFIDLSTVEPNVIEELALEAQTKGIRVVDGTVYGVPSVAEAGRLVVMLAGEDKTLDQCEAVLKNIGKTLIRVGRVGNSKRYKLAGNMLIAFEMIAASEVMVWMKRTGIDPDVFLKIFGESFDNREMAQRIKIIMKREFKSTPSWIHKDLSLALKVAGDLGLPLPMATLGRQLFLAARALEGRDVGVKGICHVYETLTGVDLLDKASKGN